MKIKRWEGLILLALVVVLGFTFWTIAESQVGPGGTINAIFFKGPSTILFGGVTGKGLNTPIAANISPISMNNYSGGALEYTINSGSGTFSMALFCSETPTGTFRKAPGGTYLYLTPNTLTVASTNQTWWLSGVKSKYIKFIPTTSSVLATATFTFTPSQ
jgi:hypothetical protein